MTKELFITFVGLILILLPQLGIPTSFKDWLVTGAGLILALLGYLLARKRFLAETNLGDGERGADTFVESTKSLFEAE